MLSRNDVRAQQERYADFRREAERDRLIQAALAQETRSGRSRIQSLRRLLRVMASRQLAPRAPTLGDADSRMPSGKLEQLEQACGQAKG